MILEFVIVGVVGTDAVSAHPHVWVTVETEVLYDQQKAITGFRHKWTFDEFYSSFAIQGLDENNDGQYDRAELGQLAEINISSLKEFGYFTFPKLAGAKIEQLPPRDYWLEYADGELTLFLTLPLKQPLPAGKIKDFSFAVYDPTFYVDFALAKDHPIRLAGAPSGCTPIVREPNPQTTQSGVSTLGETFFNDSEATADLAEQYAKSVVVSCPAG
jgi:ABC-type uncharacterized transport system substrate-binding protein